MKRFLLSLAAAAALAIGAPAFAHNSGNGNGNGNNAGGVQGSIGGTFTVTTTNAVLAGNASSVSGGGSMAESNVHGTGASVQGTVNSGGGTAYAGGHIGSDSVTTTTNISSEQHTVSVGHDFGSANGSTSGQVGTDVNAAAGASFVKNQASVSGKLSGFAAFKAFSH
jgi:hypothetical protein